MNPFLSITVATKKLLHSFVVMLLICFSLITAMGQEASSPQISKPIQGTEIIGTKKDSWRSATIFTCAIWKDMLFYGGGSGSNGGDPRHEIEIGVFHLGKKLESKEVKQSEENPFGYQHQNNPIITRKQFGLAAAGKGVTPLSILESNGKLLMFCTSRPDDDLNPRIVVITASVENPFHWSNYSVVIDQSLSGCKHNHGASAIINSEKPSEVLVYFAACSPPNDYRILLASVPLDKITNKQDYTLLKSYDNPVIKRKNAKANYPFVRYDNSKQLYELWYSGHTHPKAKTRSCFVTTSKHKDSFTPSKEPIVTPSADPLRNDHRYATGPKFHQGKVYYSGRQDASGNYRGIFVLPQKKEFSP